MKRISGLMIAIVLSATPAWAVVSVVNHVIASTAAASSLTTGTFTATAGNTLVVLACTKSDLGMTLTTSGSDTVTGIDAGNNTPALGTLYFSAFYNIAGGAGYSVTVTPGGGTPTLTLAVIELAGVPTSAVFDATANVALANITPANTTHASGSTGTLSQADEIAIAYICTNSVIAATLTQDSGYTLSDSEVGLTKAVGGLAYKVVSATTALSHTWTTDSSTGRNGV